MVKKIAKLMGKSVSVSKSLRRVRPKKSEVLRLCASTKKAKKLINWSPKFTGKNGFNEGLKKTISWFSMRENLKIYKANIYND